MINALVEKENKYLDPSTSSRSYLNDAKSLLEQGGSLTEIGLMLEAAIQQGDLGKGGYEAWILLGEVRSMDEREEEAMRALSEGVKRAEAAGATGEGMLVLVSLIQRLSVLLTSLSCLISLWQSHSRTSRTSGRLTQCC